MLNFKYKSAVYIGRFQPLHLGHLKVVKHGLELAEKLVIFIGSDGVISRKNPFYILQRYHMVIDSLKPEDRNRVVIFPVYDRDCDKKWAEFIEYCVYKSSKIDIGISMTQDITLIGCKKDSSSYYLDLFPDWDCNFIEFNDSINSTDIREDYYNNNGVLSEESINKIPISSYYYLEKLRKNK